MTPVFLLGPGRSGTTLLYKLLAAMPGVAYLSNYNARLPWAPLLSALGRPIQGSFQLKRFAWFQDEGGAYFNAGRQWYRRLIPTPVEGEAVYRACGVPEDDRLAAPLSPPSAECLKRQFERIAAAFGSPVLVSKRTVNNRRVPHLLQAFPQARFVCLLRDGRAVARSLVRVHWWADHTLFWEGRSPRELVAAGRDDLELAARNWVEEMRQMESGMGLMTPASRLIVHYDDLLCRPRETLKAVHEFIGVQAALPPAYWSFIDSLGFRSPRPDWLNTWDAAERRRVEAVQQATLRRWGFRDTRAEPA